ncbi:TlpA family protein disulfide reductase [Parapedobacter indicus]|uniref:Thiol-disulfide isomerase or thioredoxin n=1 Tax=Parapedobacter indicus TaxID=1477437 RepID=A0A1I3HSD6_9SPHI|nr:thioredoxin-like domain-containing protein [Parapedobacter indicus]PPL03147.1 thiol-disulfide isomerase/thioredoxin [Parapedobacter indicus]SFI38571.1 Thiol-disulfide isomerase or thioredoxin [Parapedobacter indicus]
MRHIKIILLLSSFTVLCRHTYPQTPNQEGYKLIVSLENAPFDSLKLFDYTDDKISLAGTKISKFAWEIPIPDSIVQHYENMALIVSRYDSVTNSSRWIRFITEKDSTKTIISNVGVEDSINYIYGVYIGKTIFPNENISASIGNKDTVVVGDMVFEDFKLIMRDSSSDISVRAEDPYFSWFLTSSKNFSYDDFLLSYIELSKKYPDSRYLISNLARNLTNYRSKKDIQKVYDNFSDKHKNTLWGKTIERFLFHRFQNIRLPTLNKVNYESIIQDSSKYNLVIFTASWCVPCIKEIPLLKEIHEDLTERLLMTYISLDRENDIPSLQKILREHDVPWRTLLAYQNIEKINERYFVEAIPHSILVYPDGEMEVIDVRNDGQRQKLYSIL